MRIILLLTGICFLFSEFSYSQSSWPSVSWSSAENITSVISSSGINELSGLYWNDDLKRLYAVENKGSMRILQLNTSTQKFSLLANIQNLDSPEGVAQVDNSKQEFFTMDESSYEIRRYSHDALFGNVVLVCKWNIKKSPSPMEDTGNDGPEGLTFIPDSYLKTAGFKSSVTGQLYTSTNGMGGLFFVAHQDSGYVWVFDINPNVKNDFKYVGIYATSRKESCEISFNRSTGLLYIMHNIDNNYLEVTDIKTTITAGSYKFVSRNEYNITVPDGNTNIEGFAISSSCSEDGQVSAWLCRDVASDESTTYKKDCLRWFKPFTVNGTCLNQTATPEMTVLSAYSVYPDPVYDVLHVEGEAGENYLIRVIDYTGKTILHKSGVQFPENMNVSDMDKGIYLLIISLNDRIVFSRKFIKTN